MIAQVSSEEQVHNQIQIHFVLKSIVHIDYEIAVDHREQLEFIHYARNAFFSDDSRFCHFFHGILFALLFLGFNAPNFTEASSTNRVDLTEVCLVDLCHTFLIFGRFKVAIPHDNLLLNYTIYA